MKTASFKNLCYGARFRYLFDPDSDSKKALPKGRVWIKIDINTIAEWDESNVDTNWGGQQLCCFSANANIKELGWKAPELATEVQLVLIEDEMKERESENL